MFYFSDVPIFNHPDHFYLQLHSIGIAETAAKETGAIGTMEPMLFNPHFGIHTGWCVLRPNGQQGPTPTTKPTLGTSLTIIWIAGIQHLATLDVVFRLI